MARENIDVTVELTDALSRPAGRAEEAIEDLRDETQRLNRELYQMDMAQQRAASANRSLDRALGRTTKSTQGHTRSLKEAQREQRGQNRVLRATQAALGGVVNGMIKASKKGRVLGVVMKAAKFSALATGATLAATAVSALGAAAVAAVAGLAPLVGVLGAVPALFASLGAAGAAIKIGFSGIGEAIKVLSDPAATAEELNAALSKLGPAARDFVVTFSELKEQASGIKDAVQAAMLPGFTRALKSIAPLIDVVGEGLATVGAVVGDLAGRGGAMVGAWGGDLRTIFASAAKVTNSLGGALLMVVSIFKNFALAGGPLAERFAAALERGALYLNHVVEAGTRSGRLTAFLERAGDFASKFWGVLVDLSVALFNIGRLSSDLGNAMGGAFSGMIRDFREFTESVEGQASIRAYFRDAIPIVMEVGRLIKDLAIGLGGMANNTDLVPLLQQVRTELLPAIFTLVDKLSVGLGPGLVDVATGLATALGSLPFSSIATLATGLGDIAMALGSAMQDSPALATTVSSLFAAKLGVDLLGGGFDKAKSAVEGFKSGVEQGKETIEALKGGVDATRDAARGAARMGQNMSRAFSGQLQRSQMGPFHRMLNRVGNAIRANTVLNAIWTRTVKIATAAMRIMGRVAKFMFGPWGIAIMLVIGALVLLYKKNEAFRELVQRVARAVVDFGKTAWAWIKKVGAAVGQWLIGVWQKAVPIVVGVAKAIWGALQSIWGVAKQVFGAIWGVVKFVFGLIVGYFKFVFTVYKTIFEIMAGIALWLFRNVIAPAAAWLWGHIKTGLAQLSAAWSIIWGLIKLVALAVWNAISTAAGWLWGVLKAGFGQLRDFLGIVWGIIKAVALAVWEPIAREAKETWEGIKSGLAIARDFLGGVWKVIKDVAMAVWAPIRREVMETVDSIKGAFDSVGRAIGGVWNGIKSAASSALGGIKGLINDIIGGINRLIGGINAVKIGDDLPTIPLLGTGQSRSVAQAVATRETGRFSGGPVDAGRTYTVAEMGPELYVPRSGPISLLGAGGTGAYSTSFAGSGWIVPNPSTPSALTEATPGWVSDRMQADLPYVGAPSGRRDSGGGAAVVEKPELHVHMHGDGSGLTVADIEAGALRAYRKWEREKKERK